LKAELIELKPKITGLKGTLDTLQKKRAALARDHHENQHVQYETLSALAFLRDESKLIREKQTRRAKHHEEIHRVNAVRVARIEAAAQQLSQLELDIVARKQENGRIERQLAETEQAYDMVLREAEELSQRKTELRKVIHKLRPRLVSTQFRLTRSDNDSLIKEREVKAGETALDKRKLINLEAEQAHSEVLHGIKTAKNETRHMKPFLEQQKDKVVVLYREIDEARSTVFRINTHVAMTEESISLLNSQTAQHLSELKELQQKSVIQTTLSDKLRDERNVYKRQFEMQEKENAEMQTLDAQLEAQILELQTKYETMLQTTALDHYTCRSISDEILNLNDMTSRCQQDILVTERIISRMQTETQTLNHILRGAAQDHLQQEKERHLLDNNKQILAQELHNKNVAIENLRSQVKVDEAFLRKCSQVYNERLLEIGQAASDLARLEGVTQQLEEKRERIRTLEYDMHRTFMAAIMEKRKCATLIYELSVPRNIHRWQIMAAVDPIYVKNMRYRCNLSARIDVAHRELIALTEERDRLRNQLAQAKKASEETPSVSKEWVERAIRTYEQDIQRIDEEISAMNEHRVSTQQLIDSQHHRLSGARTSLTERATKSQSLMTAIDQSRCESVAGEPVYYMTEAPIVPLGGGFSTKIAQVARKSAPAQLLRTRMPVPPSLHQLTKGVKPRGQQYLGRNVLLPSID
jgi:chromosome segregation ATPase